MRRYNKFTIKDIVVIAACISIIFVQEQILSFLPNIQLTIFLLVVFSKKLGFLKTSIIILIHTLLDCLITGSLNLYYFPFMILAWLSIPIIISIFFKKCESSILLAIVVIIGSLLYCWIFIIPNILLATGTFNIDVIIKYFVADIPFELLLCTSSFISIMWLYKPCASIFDNIYTKYVLYNERS